MRTFFTFLATGLLAWSATAADWPSFRGPKSSGVSPEKGLTVTWGDKQNLVWKVPLPGPGASSPIVWGDQLFVTCYTGYGLSARDPGMEANLSRHLLCVDCKHGKVLWDQELKAELPEQRFTGPYITRHGYASSTPATDGQRVYIFYGKTGVLAYDLSGKKLWQTGVGTRTHSWGTGSSPVLYKDLEIVNASVESGSLIALDKNTGKERWRKPGMVQSWDTPVLVDVGDKQELVVSVQGKLRAFAPESGEELWFCKGIQDYVCPSVIAHDGVVYAIGGRGGAAVAVRAGGRGDVTGTHVLWRASRGSNVSSQVYHDGYLYWTHEGRGIAYCVNAADGKIVYEERLDPAPDLIYASPVLAEGRLYIVSRTTGTYVLAARPMFKLLAHNTIDSDRSVFNGSPAISNGRIYLRSDKCLYCIGAKDAGR